MVRLQYHVNMNKEELTFPKNSETSTYLASQELITELQSGISKFE